MKRSKYYLRGGEEEAQKGHWSPKRVPTMKVDQIEASGSLFLKGPKNKIFWNLFSGCFVFSFRMHFPDAFSGCAEGETARGG